MMKLQDALIMAYCVGTSWFCTWATIHIHALEARVDCQGDSIVSAGRAGLKLTEAVLYLEDLMLGTPARAESFTPTPAPRESLYQEL